MNLAQIARLMAGFAIFFTLAQVPCLVYALREAEHPSFHPVAGFTGSIVIGSAVAALLWMAGRTDRGQVFRKEAIAVAGLSWFLASMLGAIPLQWSGLLPSSFDAVFEATSGLTTTGATVLGSGPNPPIPDAPESLLLWRALLQWIGGIGIVLVFVALLPAMGVTGKNLLTSESVGVGSEHYQPRALEKARLIGSIYVGLTALCALLLVGVGGFGWFEAVCHAFTTLSSGGFSTRSSIAEFRSPIGEMVITGFMFLAGTSFAVVATHWRGRLHGLRHLAMSGEFRIYALTTALLITLLTVCLVRADVPFLTALRWASFNGVSVLTSTGFATADFHAWPALALLLLLLAMLVGGCSGSTAGGIKQVRVLVILKLLAYSIRHFVRPKSVERIKLDEEVLPAAVISSILAIVLLWCLTIALGGLVLACDERFDFVAALSTSASMVGNCGPALTIVEPSSVAAALTGGTGAPLGAQPHVGPFGGFGDLRDWAKVATSLQMVLGRLELLTVLALLTPSFWRR